MRGFTAPQRALPSSLMRFRYHTQTHHTRWDFSGKMIGPSQRSQPHISKHSQEADIHSPGAIRNRNPSNRKAADPHLIPHGHRHRQARYKVQYVTLGSVRVKIVVVGKQYVLNVMSVRVGTFTSLTWHGKSECLIILSGYHFFSTSSLKRHELKWKKLLKIKLMFWWFLQILFEIFLVLKETSAYITNIMSEFNQI